MATQQDDRGVPLSIAHELQQCRLLELPSEILELLDSSHPPKLSIKSRAAPANVSSTPNAKPAYAVLCTPNKSFQLRQVQTSNSVYVIQSTLNARGDEVPVPGVTATASCTATLELQRSTESPVPYLKEVLPLYDIGDDGTVDAAGNGKGRDMLFSDIPLSDAECDAGWVEMLAFEFAGSSYRPSANTLLQVWKAINTASQADGIKLDNQFLTEDVLRAVDDQGYPADLISVILRHLASSEQDQKDTWSCLDRNKTVTFVGRTILEARHGQSDYLTADFLEAWKDSVPEPWRKDAVLATIKGIYHNPSSTTIALREDAATTSKPEDSAPKAGSSSRKWHERFGRARQR